MWLRADSKIGTSTYLKAADGENLVDELRAAHSLGLADRLLWSVSCGV